MEDRESDGRPPVEVDVGIEVEVEVEVEVTVDNVGIEGAAKPE